MKAIGLLFCSLVVCRTAWADLLKEKRTGTIVAIGTFQKADSKYVYWKDCDNKDKTFTPPKEYLWSHRGLDCAGSITGQSSPSKYRDQPKAAKTKRKVDREWREIPMMMPKSK